MACSDCGDGAVSSISNSTSTLMLSISCYLLHPLTTYSLALCWPIRALLFLVILLTQLLTHLATRSSLTIKSVVKLIDDVEKVFNLFTEEHRSSNQLYTIVACCSTANQTITDTEYAAILRVSIILIPPSIIYISSRCSSTHKIRWCPPFRMFAHRRS